MTTHAESYHAGLEAAAHMSEIMANKHEWNYDLPSVGREIAIAIRALPVPEDAGDMVLVPREPTEAMINAGKEACEQPWITQVALYRFGLIYRAMINAKE